MFENENGFIIGGDLDLGSEASDFGGFTTLDDNEAAAVFGDLNVEQTPLEKKAEETPPPAQAQTITENANEQKADVPRDSVAEIKTEENKDETVTKSSAEATMGKVQAESNSEEPQDLWSAVMAEADEKQAETKKNSLIEKLPFFEHGGAKEEIVDTSKTFEQLRLEKAEDFPELDEGENVKWKVTYGTIVKQVTDAKKTTIASMKTQIEESDEFINFLKKPDDKKAKAKKAKGGNEKNEIECKIIPMITAKKKGVMAEYKGLFNSVEEAQKSGKLISFVPSRDGKVFEVRNNKIGTFIAQTERVTDFQKVRAGFIPALPKIPYSVWSEIIAFFKSFIDKDVELEALAYIYWSYEKEKYCIVIPKQKVSKDSVDAILPDFDESKYLLVAEIHSHNTMGAYFSCIDDRDEKATRIYIVVGRMDKIFPDIKARISCGGKFVEIDPSVIMEGYNAEYPPEWKNSVGERKSFKKEAEL